MIRARSIRPNIQYGFRDGEEQQVVAHVEGLLLEGISRAVVYVPSVGQVDVLAGALGRLAGRYSSGMTEEEREASHAAWLAGRAKVMVATTAFGVGVDYPAVRHVVHCGLPYSMEDYAQESGRAGRDGLGSQSVVFWNARKEKRRLDSTTDCKV